MKRVKPSSAHKFLKPNYQNDAARYCGIFNYSDDWELTEGMVIGDDYPSNVEFRMDNDFKGFIARNDFLHSNTSHLVVQQRVREFLEKKKIPNLQFLNVVLKDHRGKKVPETYWLVNFTKLVDCIDKKLTKFKWNELDEDHMTDVSNVTVVPPKLKGVLLARAKHLPWLLIVGDSLAEEMKAEGFTGFDTKEISEYREI